MSRAAALIRAGEVEPLQPWPRYVLGQDAWAALAVALAEDPLELVGLWADTLRAHALFVLPAEAVLPVAVPLRQGGYPALSPHRPAAAWFERMIHDLWGHVAVGGVDARPWLDHRRWPSTAPMAARPGPPPGAAEPPDFLPVAGEDLHQIGLGPVQGAIAEPRHLRATALGETVIRLEARLGYAHKGLLALMRGKPPRAAARFPARLSGDATVAHSLAYARAVEAALQVAAPPRAEALRATMAELERLAMHLADCAAIGAVIGARLLPGRCGLRREALLRAAAVAFGHRLMMDAVVPGGVATDVAADGPAAIGAALDGVAAELPALRRMLAAPGVADRLAGAGIVSPAAAVAFAPGGVVGRAAGRPGDARRWPGYPPYDRLAPAVPVRAAGDAAARVAIRLDEMAESLRLLRALLGGLSPGALSVALPNGSGEGIGVAESFRGDVWHWVRLDGGLIAAAFPRDPSWLHWPLLEAAAAGAAVGDLSLIDRSFNAACSGIDL